MGYVFRAEDAERYNNWFQSEPGLSASDIEKRLMLRLWAPTCAQRVLEVGCGTGIFLDWFSQMGHQVTGLDPSPAMLDIARHRLPRRIILNRGYAEHLPYDDNAFDTVSLITSLEFVDDAEQALREAVRVARSHVLLGVLNKYSVFVFRNAFKKIWKPSVFSNARLYSVPQLLRMSRAACSGQVPVHWQTCLTFPWRCCDMSGSSSGAGCSSVILSGSSSPCGSISPTLSGRSRNLFSPMYLPPWGALRRGPPAGASPATTGGTVQVRPPSIFSTGR